MKNTVPLKSGGFKKIYKTGNSYASHLMVIICQKNGSPHNCLGIVASKKVGKSTIRNKARRRIREVYRTHEEQLHCGYDIVIIARPAMTAADYEQIRLSMLKLMKKHGILKEMPGETA